jgi:L-asparaginase
MMASAMQIRILVTGGTFDKDYDEIEGKLHFGGTRVPEMLSLGRCAVPVEVETLMLKDSLDLTDTDRERIVQACQRSPAERIVITHGTDTMEKTARAIGTAALPKTIVLTGAMVPYTFGSSDGLFNLGSALAFAQSLPPGTYVAMNGRYFPWNNVRKNRELGFFEEISS